MRQLWSCAFTQSSRIARMLCAAYDAVIALTVAVIFEDDRAVNCAFAVFEFANCSDDNRIVAVGYLSE